MVTLSPQLSLAIVVDDSLASSRKSCLSLPFQFTVGDTQKALFKEPSHCRAFGEASWQALNTRALPEDLAVQQARALQDF